MSTRVQDVHIASDEYTDDLYTDVYTALESQCEETEW